MHYMGGPERETPHRREPDWAELPPAIADAIRSDVSACVMADTIHGTAFVVKAPTPEIEVMGGTLPLAMNYELHFTPLAPVVRVVFWIFDRPTTPYCMETFVNVADPQQQREFASLADQTEFQLHFYDEELRHRLTKRVTHRQGERARTVLQQAVDSAEKIPAWLYDFDLAKREIMKRVEWPPFHTE